MTGISDRLRNIKQQKIINKHVRVRSQRGRRPILFAVPHIVVGQAVLQTLKKDRPKLFIYCERRLLVPEVSDIVDPLQSRIVKSNIGLFGTANPIHPWRWMSNKGARMRNW